MWDGIGGERVWTETLRVVLVGTGVRPLGHHWGLEGRDPTIIVMVSLVLRWRINTGFDMGIRSSPVVENLQR